MIGWVLGIGIGLIVGSFVGFYSCLRLQAKFTCTVLNKLEEKGYMTINVPDNYSELLAERTLKAKEE